MIIDNVKIDLVDTGDLFLDGGAMFGVVPKVFWSKKYDAGDELNRIRLKAKPLLIRNGEKNILIDTGCGDKYNEKMCKIYGFDLEKSNMENALKKFDLHPDDIDMVIFTHLHFDHCGGATVIRNGEIEPTFRNADYVVQRYQYEWAKEPTVKDRASFINDDISYFNKKKLYLIEGDIRITENIRVVPLSGHTKDMQVVFVSVGEQQYLYASDLIPTAAHVSPQFVMAYDNFPLLCIAEKRNLLEDCEYKDIPVIFEHDAFTDAARIEFGEKGYQIKEVITI